MFEDVRIDAGKPLNPNLTKADVLRIVRDDVVEIGILNRSTTSLSADSLELHRRGKHLLFELGNIHLLGKRLVIRDVNLATVVELLHSRLRCFLGGCFLHR